jgi:hypothetical protein
MVKDLSRTAVAGMIVWDSSKDHSVKNVILLWNFGKFPYNGRILGAGDKLGKIGLI